MAFRKNMALAILLILVGQTGVRAGIASEEPEVAYTLGAECAEEGEDACAVDLDCQECCDCPIWSVKAGAVILTRERPRSIPVVENTITGGTLLDGSEFDFNWAGGVDVTIAREWRDGDAVELRYFAVDGLSAQQSFTTSPIWNFNTTPPLFGLGTADIDAIYTTQLYNTELNFRRQALDWLTVLAGFRWIEFHERLDLHADFGGNSAVIGTETGNHLYGGQLGLDARILSRQRLTIDAYTKAGIYFNSADQTFRVQQNIGPDFGATGSKNTDAFVGELGASGSYWFTDHLAFRAGYQLMWMESVAVAADQFSQVDVLTASGIHDGGSVFFHGANVGLEYLW